jgi:hypothetical protein
VEALDLVRLNRHPRDMQRIVHQSHKRDCGLIRQNTQEEPKNFQSIAKESILTILLACDI